jgi:hypothetical protein
MRANPTCNEIAYRNGICVSSPLLLVEWLKTCPLAWRLFVTYSFLLLVLTENEGEMACRLV